MSKNRSRRVRQSLKDKAAHWQTAYRTWHKGGAATALTEAARMGLEALRWMLDLDVEHSQRGPDDDDVCSEVRAARAATAALSAALANHPKDGGQQG